jgi:hypothetical protein
MSNLLMYIYKQLQYIVKLAQSNHFSSFYHIKICNKLFKVAFKALLRSSGVGTKDIANNGEKSCF